jgi:hypothetical protein
MMARDEYRSKSQPAGGEVKAPTRKNMVAGRVTSLSFHPNVSISSGYSSGSVWRVTPFDAM